MLKIRYCLNLAAAQRGVVLTVKFRYFAFAQIAQRVRFNVKKLFDQWEEFFTF
jgi:hypothetical protein